MADASAMLKSNIPYPARLLRCRIGAGGDGLRFGRIGYLYRNRSVIKQNMILGSERYAEMFIDQQACEARTVDKQIGLENT